MGLRLSFGFARTADDFPALQLGNRLAFADAHDVADLEALGFVVGVIFLRAADSFAQHRMDEAALHLDHDGLGVGIADHHTLQHAFWHRGFSYFFPPARLAGFFVLVVLAVLAGLASAPEARALCTVMMRAMSCRTTRKRAVFSNWPLARWK